MSKTLRDKYLKKYDGGPPFRPESKPLETYIAFCEEEYDKLEAALTARVKVLEGALREAFPFVRMASRGSLFAMDLMKQINAALAPTKEADS